MGRRGTRADDIRPYEGNGGTRVDGVWRGEVGWERRRRASAPTGVTGDSAAAESLQRAAENYLKAGNGAAAQALAAQYAERMTAAQKKRFAALFEKYGAAMEN